MSTLFHLEDLPWVPVRPALTNGIFGRTLLDTDIKMVLTRVEPGGVFAPYLDAYAHLLYILSGTGLALSGGRECQLSPGTVLQIPAGEEHSYRNPGAEPLVLITLNLPA
jgi:mannose-6-phosphate isomerase-like protein (cupin superfamily)